MYYFVIAKEAVICFILKMCLTVMRFCKPTLAFKLIFIFHPWLPISSGRLGPMVTCTLKLGISILNGGNVQVQQVCFQNCISGVFFFVFFCGPVLLVLICMIEFYPHVVENA